MSGTTFACPNGHTSSDPEYCSECGKKLSPGLNAGSAPATSLGETCPDCGTPRATSGATFCEVCRYNFATKQFWSPDAPLAAAAPAVPAVSTPSPPASIPSAPDATAPPQAPPPGSARRWEAVAVVDPSLCADPDPANPVPVDAPERVFPLDFPENLIGRRSERRAIYPELDLSGDSGVSARHALLYREADGALTLLDVGSTNGTQVNGVEVTPGVRIPLKESDQITLGCWTRLTLRVVGEKP